MGAKCLRKTPIRKAEIRKSEGFFIQGVASLESQLPLCPVVTAFGMGLHRE